MAYDPDEWDDEDEPCDHEECDSDILTGVATCDRCGHRWMMTDEEMAAQAEHEAAYARAEAEWNRWQWWRELKDSILSMIPRRKRVANITNDDIPF